MIYTGRYASHCEVVAAQSIVLCVLSFAITMMVVLVKMTLMIVIQTYSSPLLFSAPLWLDRPRNSSYVNWDQLSSLSASSLEHEMDDNFALLLP